MMKVAFAFRPFPASYKPTCDASKTLSHSNKRSLSFLSALPASPSWHYPLQTSSSIPYIASFQRQASTIHVNGIPYTVIRLLGEGLHSRVYAAYDSRTNQSVAIKVVQNVDPVDVHENSKMFFKEIRYLTKLQPRNPYVIRVYNHEYDSKTQTGKIVMESGHDFRFMLPLQVAPKQKKMSVSQAKFYWAQMVDAVAILHRNGIVHSGRQGSFV
jgi:serine/threonine protein kinase